MFLSCLRIELIELETILGPALAVQRYIYVCHAPLAKSFCTVNKAKLVSTFRQHCIIVYRVFQKEERKRKIDYKQLRFIQLYCQETRKSVLLKRDIMRFRLFMTISQNESHLFAFWVTQYFGLFLFRLFGIILFVSQYLFLMTII